MGRFAPDWNEVNPGLGALEKGEYNFDVSAPKLFKRTSKSDPNVTQWGIGFSLRDGSKRAYHQFYMNPESSNEMSWGFMMAFAMCCLGFDPNNVASTKEFKATHAAGLFVDSDSDEIGPTWKALENTKVTAINVPKPDNNGILQNQFSFRPFKVAEAVTA